LALQTSPHWTHVFPHAPPQVAPGAATGALAGRSEKLATPDATVAASATPASRDMICGGGRNALVG